LLLENDYVPVLTIPILDENNVAINSENDDIVGVLQSTLAAHTIIQLIAAPGFLEDINDPNSLVERMSADELRKREEQVDGRMKRKMLALGRLFENGARRVVIADGRIENPVKSALEGKGTIIE